MTGEGDTNLFWFMSFGVLIHIFASPQTCTEYLDKSLKYNTVFIKIIQYFFGGKVTASIYCHNREIVCGNMFSVCVFNVRSSQSLSIVALPLPS